jgi:CxxC motif-containing protein (DUF1111 family)
MGIYFSKINTVLFTTIYIISFNACEKEKTDSSGYEQGEHLLGGITTINDKTINAFGHPIPQMTGIQELDFFSGNAGFRDSWVTAPASTTARDGLGPLFNARSCGACHFKDGRGRAPYQDGELSTGFLLRLSIPGTGEHNAPVPEPNYGGQLQDQAIPGVPIEASFSIQKNYINGEYPDGNSYQLEAPIYSLNNPSNGSFHPQVMLSPRVAPQMIGLGLLEAISEEDILANADPNDSDNDGISGKANYIWSILENKDVLGRFGWKANQPNLAEQVAGAFNGDMGISTSIHPYQNCTDSQTACNEAMNGGIYEAEEVMLDDVVHYSTTLAVPQRRNTKDSNVLNGKQLFRTLECTSCHIENFTTGEHNLDVLENIQIKPYTDLLLHDMGDALADNRPDFLANGKEWKTPPLWGIGLFETVNGHTRYLHDGRARNLEEAVLWHGGEAQKSTDAFKELSQTEREDLILFLKSL